MKIFLSILVYGTLFFVFMIPLAVLLDIWEWWQLRKIEAGKEQEPMVKPSVAHDIKHNNLLQRIIDAKPESPEELYDDIDKSTLSKSNDN